MFIHHSHKHKMKCSRCQWLGTFTYDSISGVAVRAAAALEGSGEGGLTGNTGGAGRVSTGHMERWGLHCQHSGEVGLSVIKITSPDTRHGGLWSPAVRGSSGRGGGRWRGGGGSWFLAGIWFDDLKMTISSPGDCPLPCKILGVRGYDLKI